MTTAVIQDNEIVSFDTMEEFIDALKEQDSLDITEPVSTTGKWMPNTSYAWKLAEWAKEEE